MQSTINLFFDLGIIERKDKTRFQIQCPLHGEKNGRSMLLNFERNTYQCKGKCQERGTLQQLLRKLNHDVVISQEFIINSYISQGNKTSITVPDGIELSKVDSFYQGNCKVVPYLENRGIMRDIYQKNKITFNPDDHRVYMPVFFNGKSYGFVSRTVYNENEMLARIAEDLNIEITSANKKKVIASIYKGEGDFKKFTKAAWKYRFFDRYINSMNLPKESILYEPLSNDDNTSVYILCEGIIDALKCNSHGYNAFAVLGDGVNQVHIDYILSKCENKMLVLGFDNDPAGIKYTQKFQKLAKQIVPQFNWNLLPEFKKDIDSLTNIEFHFLINNLTLI